MTEQTTLTDGGQSEGIGLDLGKMRNDAMDLKNAVSVAEQRSDGRQSLELDHAAEDLSSAIERLRRAHEAANEQNSGETDAFETGDRVFIDEPDGSGAVVLDTPDVEAQEYVVPGEEKTVAEYNADYAECSPSDPIVQLVFVQALEEEFGSSWTVESALEQHENGELADNQYAYPDTRLTSVPPELR